jgi:TPR repeat protein
MDDRSKKYLFRSADENTLADAQFRLGCDYEYGEYGFPVDHKV